MVSDDQPSLLGSVHPRRAPGPPRSTAAGHGLPGRRRLVRAEATVTQSGGTARISVAGDGDLDAVAAQVCRFLSLDVDALGWPGLADRDPVIADAQKRLPGLRPCGFHSPYEAAAWAVLSQRVRIVQAARLRDDLLRRHGLAAPSPARSSCAPSSWTSPAPQERIPARRRRRSPRRPSRQLGVALGRPRPGRRQRAAGQGPRPVRRRTRRHPRANTPDTLPRHERRLDAEITERYGADHTLSAVSEPWRPFRTWAGTTCALREQRAHDTARPRQPDLSHLGRHTLQRGGMPRLRSSERRSAILPTANRVIGSRDLAGATARGDDSQAGGCPQVLPRLYVETKATLVNELHAGLAADRAAPPPRGLSVHDGSPTSSSTSGAGVNRARPAA